MAAQVKELRRLVLLSQLRKGKVQWARRELERLVRAYPREAQFWRMLGGVYRQTGAPRKAIQAYKRALALNPKDLQSRYSLALLYEEENEDRLALRQYEIIAGSEAQSPLVSAAEQRRRVVERRLKLFVGRLSYSMGLGIARLAGGTTDQFRSTLSFDLSSAFRPTKRSNVTFSLIPTYTGIHDTQTDSLSAAAGVNAAYSRGPWGLTANYRYSRQMGLLVEQFQGTSINASVGLRYNARIPGFLLASGEASPLILQATGSTNDFRSARVSFFGTKGRNERLSLSLPLKGGRLITAGLTLGQVRNKHFLGTDYAYDSRTYSLGLNLPLTRRLRMTGQLSRAERRYLHPDSNARYRLGRVVRRHNTVLSAGLGLNLRLTDDMSMSASYSWTGTLSNLPVGFVFFETPRGPRPVAVQSATLGSFISQNISLGLNFNL
ncbi:MAG: tetratricopeptide repeat protein [Gammaproteobacteria bacterium]|nr:MAG: tetratricopeptide repeat protein [Gammaproteobacteria bacterium]